MIIQFDGFKLIAIGIGVLLIIVGLIFDAINKINRRKGNHDTERCNHQTGD